MWVFAGKKNDEFSMEPVVGREPTWKEYYDNKIIFPFIKMFQSMGFTSLGREHIVLSVKGTYGHAKTKPILIPDKQEGGDDDPE